MTGDTGSGASLGSLSTVHVIRSSNRADWKRCRLSAHWRWHEGWQPIVGPQALEFGTAIHAGFEAIYNPKLWTSTTPKQKLERALGAFTKSCASQRDNYLQATSQTRMTWDGRDDYAARLELGTKMLEHYVLKVHPVEDTWFRPVKVEIKFQVPVLDASGEPLRCYNSPACGQVHEHGAPVVHEGRVDAIVEDIIRGGYYIIDWKTARSFLDEFFVWRHDQLCTYSWALRYRLNIDVRGYVLTEIRKDFPKPPALLKRKTNGGKYSQDRSMLTTHELYEQTVVEGDPDGYDNGVYDDMLLFLSGTSNQFDVKHPARFHQRVRIEKSPAELKIIGQDLALEIADMLEPDVRIYPSPSQYNCSRCPFISPCDMRTRGMDYLYTLGSLFERPDITEETDHDDDAN